jgi:hypothetical protein
MIHRRHRHVHVFDFRTRHPLRHVAWGGALIAVGVAALLRSQGLLDAHDFWLVVPALLAWSGALRLAFGRDARAVVQALVRWAIAAYLVIVIEHVGGWTFATTWPVLLIAAGVAKVVHALTWRARAAQLGTGEPTC